MADTPPKIVIKDDEPPKRGPGRPRKDDPTAPSNKPGAITPDVRKALAVLDSGYKLIATGLMMFGLQESAAQWLSSADDLRKTNEDALKASPKLAKAIAGTGEVGGSSTFFVTHGMALFGLFSTVRGELAARREEAEVQATTIPDYPPTNIPGTTP